MVAAATALVVAVAGFVVAVTGFDDRPRPPSADESPAPAAVANGQIAVAQGPEADIVLLDPETGATTRLVERHQGDFEGGLQMAWSPDGSRLAYTDYRAGGDHTALFVLDMETGDVRDLTNGRLQADDPAWSPDATQIAFTALGGEMGTRSTSWRLTDRGSAGSRIDQTTG